MEIKFGDQKHPAIKKLSGMPIKDVATIAHFFGMAVVPEKRLKRLTDVAIEQIEQWKLLEEGAREMFADKSFKLKVNVLWQAKIAKALLKLMEVRREDQADQVQQAGGTTELRTREAGGDSGAKAGREPGPRVRVPKRVRTRATKTKRKPRGL